MPEPEQGQGPTTGQPALPDTPDAPPLPKPAHPAQLPVPASKTERRITPQAAKEWIDLGFTTCDRLVRGALPLGIGAVGFSELFAPDFLASIVVSKDMSMVMLSAAGAFFGLNLRMGGSSNQGGGGNG